MSVSFQGTESWCPELQPRAFITKRCWLSKFAAVGDMVIAKVAYVAVISIWWFFGLVYTKDLPQFKPLVASPHYNCTSATPCVGRQSFYLHQWHICSICTLPETGVISKNKFCFSAIGVQWSNYTNGCNQSKSSV